MPGAGSGLFDPDKDLVEPRNVTMYPVQWATVDAYAKDRGYPSTSAALRRIVDEWKQFKAAQLELPGVQHP